MVTLSRLLLVLALLPVSIGACDDLNQATKAKSSGTADLLTQTEFVTAFQDLACANLKKCCTDAGLGLDTSRCSTIFSGAGEGADNAIFNPTNAEQCLVELKATASCGTTNHSPTCNLAYKGMLEPGEACKQSLDCAKPSGGDANCDPLRGICVVGIRGELGAECQQSCEQVPNGTVYCVWGPASSGYANGTQITNCFANDGLLCGDTGQCATLATSGMTCVDDSSCSRELYCDISRGYTCQPKRALGQACVEFSVLCVAGAYCNSGTCAAKKANGVRCATTAECVGVCNCGVSGDCATAGTCTDPADPIGTYISLLILAGTCDATSP